MPRRRTGEVIEHTRQDGLTSFALRFRAYGARRYVTLGNDEEGWTRKRADAELGRVLARVDAGIWRPEDHEPEPPPSPLAPTFHLFASEWYAARKLELKSKTRTDYEWRLSNHLLPYFARYRVDQIDAALVDRFRAFKVREAEELRQALAAGAKLTYENGSAMRPLSPGVINMLIGLLAAILETAVEYGHISSNPARGRRRRVRVKRRRQSFLEADELVCILDAASELDARAQTGSSPRREQIAALVEEGWRQAAIAKQLGITSQTVAYHVSRLRTQRGSGRRGAGIGRHAIMATLGCAGLRAHELCDLNVEDVDIVLERLNVRDAKTPKGVRFVYTTPKLKGVLADYLARRGGAVGDPLFPTETGARRTPDNLRQRVFHPVIEHARQVREARGHPPLPNSVTPHTLRRTYCSLWLEAEPPAPIPWLMDQVGHEKPDTLLRIYAQVMQRDRAKIGWAFDALMAGAARPDSAANGQTNGQTDDKTRNGGSGAGRGKRRDITD